MPASLSLNLLFTTNKGYCCRSVDMVGPGLQGLGSRTRDCLVIVSRDRAEETMQAIRKCGSRMATLRKMMDLSKDGAISCFNDAGIKPVKSPRTQSQYRRGT